MTQAEGRRGVILSAHTGERRDPPTHNTRKNVFRAFGERNASAKRLAPTITTSAESAGGNGTRERIKIPPANPAITAYNCLSVLIPLPSGRILRQCAALHRQKVLS